MPPRGSLPLRSGRQTQKWPTSGQGGYATSAASGIPTASERRSDQEVAHLWARWLRNPCRLGDPYRFGAEGRIRSGPLVGKVATQPPLPRGSPPLRSGGQTQKWPTCGQSSYAIHAASGMPIASERGVESEVADIWARWLRNARRLGDPHRFRAGGRLRSGPLVGKVATQPLPLRGFLPLRSGGQNQKWPTCGQGGYVTHAASGSPTASEPGVESEVAHMWARWLRNPCRLGNPQCFRAGVRPGSGPSVGKVATQPLPPQGYLPLQSWGADSEVAHFWARWLRNLRRLGDPHRFREGVRPRSGPLVGKVATQPFPPRGSLPLRNRGAESDVAHLWARWLRNPRRLRDPHRFRAGGRLRSGPLVVKVATQPLPPRGAPPLRSGAYNQKWPTCGQGGYATLAASGIPTASERGAEPEVAHLWARWLRNPCRLREPHRFRAGRRIRSGPHVGKVATQPLPPRESAVLQSGGQTQKWPKCRQGGYAPFAASGISTASELGGRLRSGPLLGKVATQPPPPRGSPLLQSGGQTQKWPTCGQGGYTTLSASGIPTASKSGGRIRRGPLVGKVATQPSPPSGSPPLQSGGQTQKWPTCCQVGYATLAASGITTASEQEADSEVAHLPARWLSNPCRLGEPHRFGAGGRLRSGRLLGKGATRPPQPRVSPQLQSGGRTQKWPTCGQGGYATLAASGIPTASERGAEAQLAHLWARWVRNPCRLGDAYRFRAGGSLRSGPLVRKMAT